MERVAVSSLTYRGGDRSLRGFHWRWIFGPARAVLAGALVARGRAREEGAGPDIRQMPSECRGWTKVAHTSREPVLTSLDPRAHQQVSPLLFFHGIKPPAAFHPRELVAGRKPGRETIPDWRFPGLETGLAGAG